MVNRGWYKHPPMKDDCTQCHNYLKGKHPNDPGREYELSAKVPDLCNGCHDVMSGTKSQHAPAKDGDCLACHDPHSSDLRNLLQSDMGKPTCLRCHDVAGKDMIVHGPVKKNECVSCHDPHSSKFTKLMRNEEDKLCLSCHNKPVKSGDRNLDNIDTKLKMATVHAPASGGCLGCHTPHASKNKFLMSSDFHTETYVYEKGKTGTLCFTCHSDDALQQNKADATGFRNGSTNLHFVHVNRDKSRNCIICHDVHGSEGAHLIKDYSPFGKWSLPIGFTSTETGGTCLSGCHDQKTYNNKGPIAKAGETLADDKSKDKPKDKPKDTPKEKPKEVENPVTTIQGQIKVDDTINKSLIQGIGLNLVNIDSTINETIPLDKDLKFKRSNLPIGIYSLSLSGDDLEELKAKTDKPSLQIELKDTTTIALSSNINFEIKFEEPPAKKIEPIAKKEVIGFNQTRTFNYKNEKTSMQTKGLNNYLNACVEFMKANPKSRIMIVVHTDNVGTTQELQRISNNIGKFVESYLNKMGIPSKRVFTQGKGALFPIKSSATEKGKAANRRIEIKVVKQ